MKILVAEDDGNMRKILKLYLQKEGYDVECVSDGEEVLNYFEEKPADVLLLDWMMPKKDGIETCRELRLMKIPVKIIMLTAKTTSENEFHGLSVGADDYIRKPFDMKVLLIRIKKLCHIETELYFKDILLNQAAHEVYIGENRIELTKKSLIYYFILCQIKTWCYPEKKFWTLYGELITIVIFELLILTSEDYGKRLGSLMFRQFSESDI